MLHSMLLFLIDVCPTSLPSILCKTHGSEKDKFLCSLFHLPNFKPTGIPLTLGFRKVYIMSFDFYHPTIKLCTRACLSLHRGGGDPM